MKALPFAMPLISSSILLRRSSAFSVLRKHLVYQYAAMERVCHSSTVVSASSSSGSSSDPLNNDQSAAANSRAPFRMPRQSTSDSSRTPSSTDSAWSQLGLWTELTDCLHQELKLEAPTAVQSLVLPELLKTTEGPQHMAFLAATGSGRKSGMCLVHVCFLSISLFRFSLSLPL